MTDPIFEPFDMAERRGGRDAGGVDEGGGTGLATRTRAKTKQPTPYRVLMLNDDYTPMEFVVLCLQRFFRMSMEEATRVMLHVHQKGVGVCGTFSYEVAETKVTQVMDFARQNQHPLQCTMEKAEARRGRRVACGPTHQCAFLDLSARFGSNRPRWRHPSAWPRVP